jgi:hypothetical protein
MKLPGKAWLEYSIHPVSAEECELIQTAYYEPRGLVGFLYWHLFSIPHRFIFPGMLRELARRAELREGRDAGVAGADRRPQAAMS